jgi:hypothetical protein
VVEAVKARYSGAPDAVHAGVVHFIQQLADEQLILPGNGATSPTPRMQGEAERGPGAATDGRPPFVAPTLEKYMDMQALLVLDPIHEVDETGWPSVKA